MKKVIFDCSSGAITEKNLTQIEIDKIEQERLTWEEEQAKPSPPSVEEKLQLLQQAMDELLLGGM